MKYKGFIVEWYLSQNHTQMSIFGLEINRRNSIIWGKSIYTKIRTSMFIFTTAYKMYYTLFLLETGSVWFHYVLLFFAMCCHFNKVLCVRVHVLRACMHYYNRICEKKHFFPFADTPYTLCTVRKYVGKKTLDCGLRWYSGWWNNLKISCKMACVHSFYNSNQTVFESHFFQCGQCNV